MDMIAEGVITELDKKSANFSKVLDDVTRLEKKIFPKYDLHESFSRSIEEELSKTNTGLLYTYVIEDIAGFVMYCWPSSLFAHVTILAVNENYRRQGYGEALLRAVILKCQSSKIQRISLHVDPSSTPAVNLYKKLGFRLDSLVPKYYSAERDAYRMCLDVSTSE